MSKIIPDAALDQHIAILGKTGSGKTFAAKGLVEGMLHHGRQVCVIDPTGAWWGLRLAADGKGRGRDVVLLGGDHADIPLAERSGAAVARLVTEQGASVVIDTSGLHVGEYTRWFIDFAGTLYTTIRQPMHLVIDEAHHFMPQGRVPDPDAGRMLHAGNRLMSGGRSKGVRGMLITQRPAKLHKDSLTCADTLIAMRMIAPQDRAAVKEWIDGAGDPAKGKDVLDSLAQLQRGEGWVWYPEGGHLARVKFPRIRTYDSSATPTHGAGAGPKVAEIRLDEVRAALAEAVKEAEANDPKLLRAKVADLERQVRAQKPAAAPVDEEARTRAAAAAARAEVLEARNADLTKILTQAQVRAFNIVANLNKNIVPDLEHLHELIGGTVAEGRKVAEKLEDEQKTRRAAIAVQRARDDQAAAARRDAPRTSGSDRSDGISRPQAAMLRALAEFLAVGVSEVARSHVAVFSGQSSKSSGFDKNTSTLHTKGLIEYPSPGFLSLSEEGRRAAPTVESPATLAELHERWASKLSGPQARMLRVLISLEGEISREELASVTDQSPTSSGFDKNVSTLSGLGLVTYPRRGFVQASDLLFPGGLV